MQLVLTDTAGRDFPASSLSDGTLRFLALSVLERDVAATGGFREALKKARRAFTSIQG
jgi:hypothetical protein